MLGSVVLWVTAVLGAEPEWTWNQTAHSLALLRGDRVVWQAHYQKDDGKPYFHPLTIGGGETLTDLRPADHPWHRALWFSWKKIDGLVYWEENPQTGQAPGETELVAVQATPREDHAARLEFALGYHPPGQPPVLTERRVVEVSAPAADGAYHIDWLSTFTAGDAAVLLDRTPIAGEPQGVAWGGYAGLSLRLAKGLQSWQFADPDGPVNAFWKQARWMAFSGPLADGRPAAIVVLEHPTSFRHPTPWYLIKGMPYFSPAVLYRSPFTLPAQQSLTLKYRILLQPAPPDRDAVEKQWQAFAAAR